VKKEGSCCWENFYVQAYQQKGIIVLKAHATAEDRSNYLKERFYEELQQVFDHFPAYHIEILLGDFNTKLGRKVIIWNWSLHRDSMIKSPNIG
jgi:hypothetical protein